MKSSKISQMVSDHLHKRRAAETGFRASLVDVFVKNREKLKKSSRKSWKKKRRSPPITSSDDDYGYDSVNEGSRAAFPSDPLPANVGSLRHSSAPPPLPPPSCVDNICIAGPSGGGSGEKGRDVKSGLIRVAKVFVVVALAAATKRLTVGITIAAVLLLLLEYCGGLSDRLFRYKITPAAVDEHKRGGDERGRDIKSGLIRVTTVFAVVVLAAAMKRLTVGITIAAVLLLLLLEYYSGLLKPFAAAAAGRLFRYKRNPAAVDEVEIQPEKSKKSLFRYRLGDREIEMLETAMKKEESINAADDPKRKTRKAMIKSKMRKIVPKKLRRGRKERDEGVDECDIDEESENGGSV